MTQNTEERDPYGGFAGTRTLDKDGNVIPPQDTTETAIKDEAAQQETSINDGDEADSGTKGS